MKAAEKKARELFEVAVLAKGDCVVCGARAQDPHHVIPKQTLKAQIPVFKVENALTGLVAMTRETLAQWRMELVWDPRNGVPICRRCHGPITTAAWRLSPSQIPPETLEFATDHELEWKLQQEVPGLFEGGAK